MQENCEDLGIYVHMNEIRDDVGKDGLVGQSIIP